MKKVLKEKITQAFQYETPDNEEKIIDDCKNATQNIPSEPIKHYKRKITFTIASAICAVLFITGIILGNTLPLNRITKAATTVYLDVNPSIEIDFDKKNRVISCIGLNVEAEEVLSGLEFYGAEMSTAINSIISSMYIKGYLENDNNSMLISVDTAKNKNSIGMMNSIVEQVNNTFSGSGMQCAIIAQGVEADRDLRKRAEKQGISVGKMYLVDKMIAMYGEMWDESENSLSDLEIKELSLIYATKPCDNYEDDVLISGNVSGYVEADTAYKTVLEYAGVNEEDVELYRIFALPYRHGNIEIIYTVSYKIKGEEKWNKYAVDCLTGEICEDIDFNGIYAVGNADRRPPL